VLFLARFPRQVRQEAKHADASPLRRGLNLVVSLGIGMATTALMLAVLALEHPERIGPWFLEATVPLAMGTNAVNTIIVDFRGFDTLLEIAVMVIAALGCLGLLYRVEVLPPSHVAARSRPDAPNAFAPDGPHASPIFRAVALVFFFIVNLLAVYLLLRGHNEPGGGFIAGVATAVSLILLSFSNGFSGVQRLLRLDPLVIASLGLLLSVLTAAVPLLFGDPFLETYNWKGKDLPFIGELYLGTPILFDLGVYFVVVGVIAKVVFALRQSTTARADLLEQAVGPYHAAGEEAVEEESGKQQS
jgi:multicomponent K+:H+ antiporter subunit A